ncbi:hypothetical protein EGW08_004247 [Elysia chlorotica]|uniref:Uncharacterized protein n=1 Tax=Elysia chlorotica TaxID=188477 RepID=A0A3S1CB67_ELYCH|nr:hypothetical protein EGW08_004247 [Elysia chlorotica]
MTRNSSMADKSVYRSKLRTPKKEQNWDDLLAQPTDLAAFLNCQQLLNTPSPVKRKAQAMTSEEQSMSPHKSGYFLRTPSPQKRAQSGAGLRDQYSTSSSKHVLSGTPNSHKAGPGVDLFGNRSLLDGLPVPEWDDNFLDNLFFGLGNDDLDMLSSSPKSQGFLNVSPLKHTSPSVSPLKSPLLTSSPKFSANSPSGLVKTPAAANGRPLTRQRKLFLQSPERQVQSGPSSWPTQLPFSSFDETSSSMLSDDLEATTSIQSISSYLKQIDEEDSEEVVPPIGWTAHSSQNRSTSKHSGKGKGKSSKSSKTSKGLLSAPSSQVNPCAAQGTPHFSGKKARVEPQFTLLRPHTELRNNQICLRMAPRTPPNKVKISRDLSQIQTLPSKEQLKIVRNRFRESLNKAVEQVIEEEEKKRKAKEQQKLTDPALRSALQRPAVTVSAPVLIETLPHQHNVYAYAAIKPQLKKRR